MSWRQPLPAQQHLLEATATLPTATGLRFYLNPSSQHGKEPEGKRLPQGHTKKSSLVFQAGRDLWNCLNHTLNMQTYVYTDIQMHPPTQTCTHTHTDKHTQGHAQTCMHTQLHTGTHRQIPLHTTGYKDSGAHWSGAHSRCSASGRIEGNWFIRHLLCAEDSSTGSLNTGL